MWDSLNSALREAIESYKTMGVTFQQLKDGLVTTMEKEMAEKATNALKEHYEQFVDFRKDI